MIKKTKNKTGFVALTSILLLSAFFIVMFVAMSYFATESLARGMAHQASVEALALSNSCANVALNELKENDTYSVTDQTVDINGKSCTIDSVSTNTSTNITTIETSASVDGHVKQSYLEVDISGWRDLIIIKWVEIGF